jgi:release factor glutamine methyltransferase
MQTFYGLEFETSPKVNVPYVHTEKLVAQALEMLRDIQNPRICDAGTGSGNVAISLLKNLPGSMGTALDISTDAVRLANANARKHGVDLTVLQSNVLDSLTGEFDLIISNLPCLSAERAKVFPVEQRPMVTDGKDGLSLVQRLVEKAPNFLKSGAFLVVEYSEYLLDRVLAMFDARVWKNVEVLWLFENSPLGVRAQKI